MGAAMVAWFAFGIPPLGEPALRTGSDYAAISGGSVMVMFVGAVTALIGVILAIDGKGGPDEWRPPR